MSFQYGSDSENISNPFVVEGRLSIITGTICSMIGIIAMFTLRRQIISYGLTNGWINWLISVVLLAIGVNYVVFGLFKLLRFYVGRDVPASLATNLVGSKGHESNILYTAKDLNHMLMGRKNSTFFEPKSIMDRLIYQLYPRLIFVPYPIRNFLHGLITNCVYGNIFHYFYTV